MESKTVEVTGKTQEEALQAALEKLDATEDQVRIDSVEPTQLKGFLGLGSQEGVLLKVTKLPSAAELGLECLQKALECLQLEGEVKVTDEDDEYVYLEIEGEDLGRLIGRHGQTLEALQFIATLLARKRSFDHKRLVVDAAGYRERRREKIVEEARRLATRVLRTGAQQAMQPANSAERRIAHLTIAEIDGVVSESFGEGSERHVVIRLEDDTRPYKPVRSNHNRRNGRPRRSSNHHEADSKSDSHSPAPGPGRITSFGEDDIEWG